MGWGWDVNVHLHLRHACDATPGMGWGGGEMLTRKQRKSSCKTLLDILGRKRKKTATKVALTRGGVQIDQKNDQNSDPKI